MNNENTMDNTEDIMKIGLEIAKKKISNCEIVSGSWLKEELYKRCAIAHGETAEIREQCDTVVDRIFQKYSGMLPDEEVSLMDVGELTEYGEYLERHADEIVKYVEERQRK